MPKRSVEWNETLAEELSNINFAKDFLLALMDEGESVQGALGKTIRGFGIKEFCSIANWEPSSVQRAINLKHNPTKDTLEKLLEPFGLTLGVKNIKDGAA